MPSPSTTERNQRDGRLNLRTSSHQQQLIRSAAAALDKSVTNFVLDSATANAERVLADRHQFDGGDTEFLQVGQVALNPLEATQQPHMQFIDDHILQSWRMPRSISPGILLVINHF